jgi:hypothetical protein
MQSALNPTNCLGIHFACLAHKELRCCTASICVGTSTAHPGSGLWRHLPDAGLGGFHNAKVM